MSWCRIIQRKPADSSSGQLTAEADLHQPFDISHWQVLAVVRGWIGVEPNELTPELAQTFGIQTDQGVIVTGVLNNGPAANAGMRPGDVITQVGGQPVRTVSELLTRIAALAPGQATPFTLQRRGESVHAQVTPAQRPQPRGLPRQR